MREAAKLRKALHNANPTQIFEALITTSSEDYQKVIVLRLLTESVLHKIKEIETSHNDNLFKLIGEIKNG